jgi:pilus assembly protein Flp/PilA
MLSLYTRLQARSAGDEGATAVEYGIMVALIAVAIIVIVATLGDTIAGFFTDTNTTLNENAP